MNNIPLVFWLIPIASVVALGMAWFFFRSMMKEDEGTERMKEIAAHVRKGAMAYLKQQYKVVTIVWTIAQYPHQADVNGKYRHGWSNYCVLVRC